MSWFNWFKKEKVGGFLCLECGEDMGKQAIINRFDDMAYVFIILMDDFSDCAAHCKSTP